MGTTIPDLMRLLQFSDSLLPVGAFSFSNGLESAIQLGVVDDVDTLRQFVRTAVQQAATSDGIAVLAAVRAAQEGDLAGIIRVDRAVHNRKLNEEMRLMTVRMGCKLAELSARVVGPGLVADWLARVKAGGSPGCYPVGQGVVFACLGLSEQDAFAAHQYGLSSMMIGASLRLMRIHYLEAQAVLFDVNAEAEAAYQRVAGCALEDMAGFAPVTDLVASAHVRATVRLFMN